MSLYIPGIGFVPSVDYRPRKMQVPVSQDYTVCPRCGTEIAYKIKLNPSNHIEPNYVELALQKLALSDKK